MRYLKRMGAVQNLGITERSESAGIGMKYKGGGLILGYPFYHGGKVSGG